jgi:hypothetical protein
LKLASSDSRIIKPDATSLDGIAPGTGADKGHDRIEQRFGEPDLDDGAKLLSVNLLYHEDGRRDDSGNWIYRSIERYIEFFFGRTVQLAMHPFKLPDRQRY